MRKLFFIAVVFTMLSCGKEEKKETAVPVTQKDSVSDCAKPEKELIMYDMSELSKLMEQMYAENSVLKQRIEKAEPLGVFPKEYLKISTAAMTDESERDAFFEENAAAFIKAQQLIYADDAQSKEHFNAMVDACIQCHMGKCGGPISRIKKLYIK